MTSSDALILIAEIRKGKKLSPRDTSIVNLCEAFIQRGRPLSRAQSWALQNIYRRSQGAGERLYSRVETLKKKGSWEI